MCTTCCKNNNHIEALHICNKENNSDSKLRATAWGKRRGYATNIDHMIHTKREEKKSVFPLVCEKLSEMGSSV